ncbi:MAG: hypothetical protein EB165_06325, partial [Euryarchaeota archaeon]|nr:hypothetical protein [Euryarchaeota archaeon]
MSGDPSEIAAQKGWTGDNFGWYRDQNGQVVARSIGGRLVVYDGDQQTTPAQTDMGNPAVTAGQKPADRARSMGLQSNGKGGYMDDSGNVVARTVNNELVFYDQGPSGGAVSDGAGGMALTQSQPSWVDPVSGLILVPPAQPETPEEIAAVPDPVPAQPPLGFDNFIQKRHQEKHDEARAQAEAEAEVQRKEQELNQLYGSNESTQKFKQLIDIVVQKAAESGDEYKMDISARVAQQLETRAEEIVAAFDKVESEKHEELASLAKKMLISTAKAEWAQDNLITPIEEDENTSEEEKLDQYALAYASERGSAISRYAGVG